MTEQIDVMTLEDRFRSGDERALARAISLIESGSANGQRLLQALRVHGGEARIIGITGSPGSGKSTLVDRLIGVARERRQRVAVVAVDPTSPFSGGAILGDRIRMTRHYQDEGVYIRSMAARGHLGGLAAATLQVVVLLDAFGFDDILIETVGVGQSEVDIVQVADTTALVLTPGSGDGVQAFKAGVMEIADIFVINKYDQPGGERLKRELQGALELAHPKEGDWWPPIHETVATTGEGAEALYERIHEHRRHLERSGGGEALRKRRARFEISSSIGEQVRRRVSEQGDAFVEAVLKGELTVEEAVVRLIRAEQQTK